MTLAIVEDRNPGLPSNDQRYMIWTQHVLLVLITYMVAFPFRIVFARIAASMLPEDDEEIFPVDRKRMSYIRAWRSFKSTAQLRLLKIQACVFMASWAIFLLEEVLDDDFMNLFLSH